MSKAISWVLELEIQEGQKDAFTTLVAEMSDATKAAEPGALTYEWFIDDAGSAVHIYERYADSDAAMTHLGNFSSKFADRFLATLAPMRLTVYGSPSDELRAALAGLGAVHMSQVGGFAR